MKVHAVGSHPHVPIGRRDFIRAGTLGAASLLLPGQLFASTEGVNLNANYRVVEIGNKQYPMVVIWLDGGMSHIDTFSSLPNAPSDIRGPFGHIQSSVPGLPISEKLPLMARQMHNVALLKNIHHTQGTHQLATNRMFTGSDDQDSNQKPRYEPYVVRLGKHLGRDNLGYAIFTEYSNINKSLGTEEALVVGRSYNQQTRQSEFRSPFGDRLDLPRHRSRMALLNSFNGNSLSVAPARRWDELQDRANSILDGDISRAFDMDNVPASERERYGRTYLGESAIIAKRMVEAGAPLILIHHGGWDNHDHLVDRMNSSLPVLDKVLSSLINDLKDRAVIVLASEFGRTPKMNEGYDDEYTGEKSPPGRDHWPFSNFMLVAGPGINPQVVGRLDNTGQIVGERFDAALMGPTILRAAGYELKEDRGGALSADPVPYYPIFS